jgi:hypothetical protein
MWSSLLRIEEVDELLSSTNPEDSNMVHGSILSFFERVQKFKKEHPSPPTSSNVRGFELLSLDCYFNERFIKSIGFNL